MGWLARLVWSATGNNHHQQTAPAPPLQAVREDSGEGEEEMSEKKVRDCLEWSRTLAAGFQRDKTLVRHAEETKWRLAAHEAVLQDPDVVEVLRLLLRLHDNNVSGHDRALYLGIAYKIEKQFHVRLTDNGWEWTDEPKPGTWAALQSNFPEDNDWAKPDCMS